MQLETACCTYLYHILAPMTSLVSADKCFGSLLQFANNRPLDVSDQMQSTITKSEP